jgi:hypothetical protein
MQFPVFARCTTVSVGTYQAAFCFSYSRDDGLALFDSLMVAATTAEKGMKLMKSKLLIIAAAAMLAGATTFASAQTRSEQNVPGGANSTEPQPNAMSGAPAARQPSTTSGQGSSSNPAAKQAPQPGGIDSREPPQGAEPASPLRPTPSR